MAKNLNININLKILAQTIIRYNFSNVKRLFVITFQMSTIIRYNFLNEPLIGQQQKKLITANIRLGRNLVCESTDIWALNRL